MAAYSAGTAYLEVIPSFDLVQKRIQSELKKMEAALGKEAGSEYGKQFQKEAVSAVDKALDTSKNNAAKAGKESAEAYGGAFERLFQNRMKAVMNTIPKVKVDLDSSDVVRNIGRIRTELKSLSDVKIGADISANEAIAKAEFLKTVISDLGNRKDVSLDLIFDTKAAAAELETFVAAVKATTERDLTIKPRVEGSFGRTVRAQLEGALADFAVEPNLATGLIDAEAAALRLRLQELLDLQINGYLDAGEVVIKAGEIALLMERLEADSVDIEMKTNAAAVAGQLSSIVGLVKTIDDLDPEIEVKTGRFESTLQQKIKAALDAVPPVDINANTSPAEREIVQLRRLLFSLGDKRIGIDIDGAAAIAQAEELRRAFAEIANDETVDFKVRADAAGAAAELLAVRALAKLVDDTNVEIEVKVDGKTAIGRIEALKQAVEGTGADGQTGANAFRSFNFAILGVAAAAPAAVPALGALAGAAGLVGVMGIGGATGIGVLLAAFNGIGDAVSALGKVEDEAGKSSAAAAANAKRVQSAISGVQSAQRGIADAARGMEDAQRRVGDAQRGVERAEVSAARAGADAQRRVSDARERAARVAQQSARQVENALESQEDAERDLARAQEAVVKAQAGVVRAQEAVTEARERATRRMEDLRLATRGGALDERQAILDLARARTAYNAAVADPGATRTEREELLLSLEQEQLRVEEVRASNARLAEEQDEARRTGIEGSREVIAAQGGVVSAQEAVVNAQENVADASERVNDAVRGVADAVDEGRRAQLDAAREISDAVANQARVQADGAQQVADAQRSVADAQRGVGDAQRGIEDATRRLTEAQTAYTDALLQTGTQGSAAMDALELAMGKLSPAGREFALFLFSIKDELRELRDIAQAGILPGVQEAISAVLTENGPLLREFVTLMSGVIGDTFRDLGELLTSSQWQEIFAVFNQYAPIFMQQFGQIGMNLLTFFGELFKNLAPDAATFGDALVILTEQMANWAANLDTNQGFQDFMTWLFTEGPVVFGIIVDVLRAVGNIVIALAPLGEVTLGIIGNIAQFIAEMDPDVLGSILTILLGLVVAFQLASGALALVIGFLGIISSPLTLMVFLIGAAITALVVFYTQSETFRNIMDTVFRFIGAIAVWLFDNILKPYFEYGIAVWTLLGNVFMWVWENLLWPVFTLLGEIAVWLWESVLMPTFDFIIGAWNMLATAFLWAWENVIWPMFNLFAEIAKWLLIVLAVVVFGPLVLVFQSVADAWSWAYENIIRPVFNFFMEKGRELLDYLQPVFRDLGLIWESFLVGMKWIYDTAIAPLWGIFKEGLDGLDSAFETVVGAIGRWWDSLKEMARGPINFVIGTVLNDGLIAAFNGIIGFFNLPDSWKIAPLKLAGAPPPSRSDTSNSGGGGSVLRRAAGGPVPGWSPNDVADNIPALLTADEHVMPRKRVRQYGMDFLESLRHGEIDPAAARSLMPVQRYASGGPVYQQVFNAIKKKFPRARLNSGLRPGDRGLHGQGLATDLGEEGFAGGQGRPYLADMNRYLHDTAGAVLHELIYTGRGDDRPDLKAGKPLNYGAATNAAHVHHVHVGVKNLGAFLAALSGAPMPAGSDGSGGVVFDWVKDKMKDAIKAPLNALAGAFGNNPLARAATGFPNKLIDAAFEWLSGKLTAEDATGNTGVPDVTGGSARQIVQQVAATRGWGSGAQWDALVSIIQRESGFNPNAQNPNSTAYGLFQFLNGTWAGTGIAKTSDPARQTTAGLNYIASRYKDPLGAKRFWDANHWYSEGGPVSADASGSKAEAPTLYDTGGWLPPGVTTVLNATNKPEPILTGQQWEELTANRRGMREPAPTIGTLEVNQVQSNAAEVIDEVNHWVEVYAGGGRYTPED